MGTSIRALGGMFGVAKSARQALLPGAAGKALVPGLTGTSEDRTPLETVNGQAGAGGFMGGLLGAMFARARVRANVTKRPGVSTTYTRPPTGGAY